MEFIVTQDNGTAIIETNVPKLNAVNAPELKAELVLLNKGNINNILIDMSKTTYCDSSGLSAILVANRMCKDTNGKFVLCGLNENVLKMVQIAQLDKVFIIAEDRSKALEII